MSRIANALSKMSAATAASTAAYPGEQPWGDDLAAGIDADGTAVEFRAPENATQEPADAETPATASGPIVGAIPPALADRTRVSRRIDGLTDSRLAAMVERVFLPVSGEPIRSIGVVGVGALSSAITVGAAQLLVHQTGCRVCLVDANFAAPTLHERFSVPNDCGLADAIEQGFVLSEAVREVQPNLWLLSAGTTSQRPSFASDAVRRQMAQFIAGFDYVLMDIEAINGSGDAGGLAPLAAGIILVVSADSTRRTAARRAAETLRGCGSTVIGAVLTNRRFPIPQTLYRRL